MAGRFVVDIETNGLYESVTKVHCIVLYDIDNHKLYRYIDNRAKKRRQPCLDMIRNADLLIMHNGIAFDMPVLNKMFGVKLNKNVYDTFIVSQLLFPEPYLHFEKEEYKLPTNIRGGHSLAAWGYRLNCYKGDYTGPWDFWNESMQAYCEQDVKVTYELYKFLEKQNYSKEAIQLELDLAHILHRIEKRGWSFDKQKGIELYGELSSKRLELSNKLKNIFGMWIEPDKYVIPKKTLHYKDPTKADRIKDSPFTQIKYLNFNPSSRHHIITCLKRKYNWQPVEYTEKGNPKVDDSILESLKYPEAQDLAYYMMLNKRIGQLAEGDKAWLKLIKDDNRIHGTIKQNGTRTGRCAHYNPNMSQVPAIRKPYGKECRELFIATKDHVLVGCDADGLELRCLAGFMCKFDNGVYIKAVTEGKKELETDIHSINANVTELDRETVKTLMYALIYGAGDRKLGIIVNPHITDELACQQLGREYRNKLETGVDGFKKLIAVVKRRFNKNKGVLQGLDGRLLHAAGEHAALNTILQSAGALIMKQSIIILDEQLQKHFVTGQDYEFVGFIHDELQIECRPDIADIIGKMACRAIERAGEHFNFLCPMKGDYIIGKNWAETH